MRKLIPKVFALIGISARAYDFCLDGIYYFLGDDKTVEVNNGANEVTNENTILGVSNFIMRHLFHFEDL